MKIAAPITVLYNDVYVAPGTMIDLPKADAEALTARFGEYEGPAIAEGVAPQVTAADAASIAALNLNHAIVRGALAKKPETVEINEDGERELHYMSKAELLAEAERLKVPGVKQGDKKEEILLAIEDFKADQA